MPGVGKSTVGVLLAKRLGLSFMDTDIYIQVREGRSLQAIIQAHGPDEFCRIEEKHILSIAVASHVIAPGGSIVYSPRAMAHLKTNAIAIHLDIAVDRLSLVFLGKVGIAEGHGHGFVSKQFLHILQTSAV